MSIEIDVGTILRGIDSSIRSGRTILDEMKVKYSNIETDRIVKSDKLIRMYGDAVDDYGVLSSVMVEVSEAMMDIRLVKRALRVNPLPVSLDKKTRDSIEFYMDMLSNLRDAVVMFRESLNARLRFYNSCQYQQIDKIYGDKC